MDPIIIVLLALAVALIIINIRVVKRQIDNNKITSANNKKLEELCKGLYFEYAKVKRHKWANDTISGIIHDLVNKETCT